MRIFHDLMYRLRRRNASKKIELCFSADAHIARFAAPLIDKLLADDPNGKTYRCTIAHWHLAERPPLALYLGSLSRCRIDGPLQDAPADYPNGCHLPLGGLLNTPGVTAHLTPFEAKALQHHIQEAIEREIVAWANEHQLYDRPRGPAAIDRQSADLVAKAQIASWTPESGRSVAVPQGLQSGSDHV